MTGFQVEDIVQTTIHDMGSAGATIDAAAWVGGPGRLIRLERARPTGFDPAISSLTGR